MDTYSFGHKSVCLLRHRTGKRANFPSMLAVLKKNDGVRIDE